MSVVEEEITLPVVTFKRQRFSTKVYLCRIVTETLDQIQNASAAQENPKFKVMPSCNVIVDKLNLIKSFDDKVLNNLTSEEDIEKEYFPVRAGVTRITSYILCACVRYCQENKPSEKIIFSAVSQQTSLYHQIIILYLIVHQ